MKNHHRTRIFQGLSLVCVLALILISPGYMASGENTENLVSAMQQTQADESEDTQTPPTPEVEWPEGYERPYDLVDIEPEVREYVPPSEEVIARTKEQVDSFSCSTVTDVPVSECDALVALYASTNGAGWINNTNWLITNTVEDWYGIDAGGSYSIYLDANNLNGNLPMEIGNLHLGGLSLSDNLLIGSIPSGIGINNDNLRRLDLSNNHLSGSIPSGLGNNPLKYLYLNNNLLTGNIPPDFSNLTQVEYLNLNNNQLTGNIPPLGFCFYANLSNNQLSGLIPAEFGNLASCESLDLHSNQLSGPIPPELGNMDRLYRLNLGSNQLSGAIPPELGNLPVIGELYLNDNQLTGGITALGNLSNIYNIDLSNNRLTGTIPTFNYLSGGKVDFSHNFFSGPLPVDFGSGWYVDLSHNNFSGIIPDIPFPLSNAAYFYINSNDLTGELPFNKYNLFSKAFHFYENEICEPTTPEFLSWKATISDWRGTGYYCSPMVEINQGLGNQKDGEQNYVAGKSTVIRVILETKINVDPSTQQLEVTREGSMKEVLYPRNNPFKSNILEFYCPSYLLGCGSWPAGNYTFNATIGEQTLTKSATFTDTKGLKILVVPIYVNDGGEILTVSNDQLKDAYRFLNKTYPISDTGITKWTIGTPMTYPKWLLQSTRLRLILADLTFISSFTTLFYDKVIAIMPPISLCTEDGCMLGGTPEYFPRIAVIFANGSFIDEFSGEVRIIDSMQAIVAHEIGHTYGLGDEYNINGASYECEINPPPATYGDWSCPNSKSFDWNPEDEDGKGTGSKIPSEIAHPYDITIRSVLPDKLSFMGSGEIQSNFWISQDAYSHLFSEMQIQAFAQSVQSIETGRVIVVSGVINGSDQITLSPWYHFNGEIPTVNEGSYSVDALGPAGDVLATQNFDVSFTLLSNPPIELEEMPFAVTLGFPSDTTRFIIRKGTTELSRIEIPSVKPAVTLISPNGGEVWGIDTEQTITWDGESNELLHYSLFLSGNGTDWQVLATDLTDTTYTFNTGFLAGSDNVLVKILATDGVNTVEDVSDAIFSITGKPPEINIGYPTDGETIPHGLSIVLDGYGYDLEDGLILDERVTWLSSIDGFLGSGGQVLADLSIGNHVLTINVSDSDGEIATKSISISVVLPSSLSISSNSIGFSGSEGSNITNQELISIQNIGGGELYWSARADQNWVILSESEGYAPTDLFVSSDLTDLDTGSYTATITVTATDSLNSPQLLTINLQVLSTYSAPIVNSINKTQILAGSPGFTLTVNGEDFLAGDEVYWNGSPRPTTFVSATQLTAAISTEDLLEVAAAEVTVVHPGYEDYPSNSLIFKVYTFADVLPTHPMWRYIEGFYAMGITGGCTTGSPLKYCPNNGVTRQQMAIFLLRAIYGSSHVPPPATGVFTDVPVSSSYAPWIEEMASLGITGGCSMTPLKYCPDKGVTRAQMAIFLLRAKEGSTYTPPPATGMFDDVPVSNSYAPWIEELARRGVTGGCSTVPYNYCPNNGVTRAQMATFVDRMFEFPQLP